ncbi:MAG: General stress protein CTC [Microgenomates bacterium OLB23]|nr:MAG: General stress protein CTC [Microgenomates bacterium OLB23]
MTPKDTKKTGEKLTLSVQKRTLLGKKVKQVRAEGNIPANIYGKDMDSIAIQVNAKDFTKALHVAGLTQVIYLSVDSQEIPSMIQNVQTDPISDHYIHADFRKVNLNQKLEAQVPVTVVGESEAVAQNKGDLMTLVNALYVEALPTDMPQEIEVDIADLKEVGDEIKVSDLKKAGNYVVTDEPETVIVRIAEHKEESLEPDTEAAIVEGEGEAAEGGDAAAEGEASTGGDNATETPAEEK